MNTLIKDLHRADLIRQLTNAADMVTSLQKQQWWKDNYCHIRHRLITIWQNRVTELQQQIGAEMPEACTAPQSIKPYKHH